MGGMILNRTHTLDNALLRNIHTTLTTTLYIGIENGSHLDLYIISKYDEYIVSTCTCGIDMPTG